MENESPATAPPGAQPPLPPPPYATAAQPLIYPMQPARDPLAALMLNIFFASVGYFIIGQIQKGIAASVAFLIELVFHAILSVDVYLQAKVLQSGKPITQWTFFNQAARS